jgi:hypothetical protein
MMMRTIECMDTYGPGQIRNIAQCAANIAKHYHIDDYIDDHDFHDSHHPLVHGDMSHNFWSDISRNVTSNIDLYRPKWLVSVTWAFATIITSMSSGTSNRRRATMTGVDDDDYDDATAFRSRNRRRREGKGVGDRRVNAARGHDATASSSSLDASSLFRAIRRTFHERRGEFTSKHMGNIAWSCVTCRVSNDDAMPLMRDLSNEFVRRRRMEEEELLKPPLRRGLVASYVPRDVVVDDEAVDGLDPMTLSQWANSYAKAGHADADLYNAISTAAIPMLGEFDPRHFSNLSYAFALAGHTTAKDATRGGEGSGLSSAAAGKLFDEIAAAATHRISSFSSQNMANIAWAYAKLNHPSPGLFNAIAREAIPRTREFSAQQLSNIAWAYSKAPLTAASDSVFDCVADEVASRGLDSFTMQGIAMLAHSFATVGHVKRVDFWDAIDRAATTRRGELGAIESSQLAWSFATIRRPSDKLFHSIETFVLSSNANTIKPQGLSNLAWAFAMLEFDSPEFFRAIGEESLGRLDEFAPEDEVMLILAYSRTRHTFPELVDRIASSSLSHLSQYTGLDLFNLVISYVRLGRQSRHWMDAIASEIIRRPSAFSPQVIVGITWAYASVGCRIPALLNFLSEECISSCDKLKPKELASLAWSFAALDYFHRPLMSALADSSEGRWSEFDASSLANMAWAFATAREDRPLLFEGIVKAAIDRRGEFTPQGVSMLLWSCSAAGHLDRDIFLSMETTARMLLHQCDCQSLANIAWAYTVADLNAEALFGPESPFVHLLVEKYDKFDHRGLCQLHQWNIWRTEVANDSSLPAHIKKRCYHEFTNQPLHESILQKNVISELAAMGFPLEEEVRMPSGYSLDAVVKVNGSYIGLEVDGPHHFVGIHPTGSTILKHRQVASIDRIPVVSLPYWELNDLGHSVDRQQYLRTKLGLDSKVTIDA